MFQYFLNVAGEFKQIRWLSVRRAFMLTLVVVVSTFAAGFVLGAVDNVFTTLLRYICYIIKGIC